MHEKSSITQTRHYMLQIDIALKKLHRRRKQFFVRNDANKKYASETLKRLKIENQSLVNCPNSTRKENNKFIKSANDKKNSKAIEISSLCTHESKLKEKDARIMKLETVRLTKE